MTIPAIIGDRSKLEDIYFRFGEHYTPDLAWINKAFDSTYGSNLPDFNVIFENGNTWTKLKSNVIHLIKDPVVDTITPVATDTVDPALIRPIVNAMPLYTRSASGQCLLLRSLDKLVAALNRAIIGTKIIALPPSTLILVSYISKMA